MKVLFIYSNHATYLSPHYNHGIGFLAAVLKREGHEVALFSYDCPVEREDLIERVKSFGPDLVGFSVSTNQYKYARKYSGWIKEDLGIRTIIGGVHAMLAPERVFKDEMWDYLVVGEAEDTVVELADALDNDRDHTGISNLWLRKGGDVIKNELRPLVENLDSIPYPDREVFDIEHLLEGDRKVLSFLAGRGCPYVCTYCSNPAFRKLYKGKGRWVRFRSPENLLGEIRTLLAEYSPRILDFNDDIFTLDHEWTGALLEGYRREFKLPFRCNVRVETVDKPMLEALKSSGCDAIRVGVEQGDENFRRKVLKRTMTNEQLQDVFDWAHELDLKAWSFNMLGFPGETPELARETLELNRRIRPDHLQISIFNPYPGTALWDECLEKGYLPEDAEAMDGYFVPDTPLDLPTMSHEQLKATHREFVDLSNLIKDEIRLGQKYRDGAVHYNLMEMLGDAQIDQPTEGYVSTTYFTMDEDARKTLQEHPPSRISYRLRIPPGARFEAAIAIHPEVWEKARGDGVVFEVLVSEKRLLGKSKPKAILQKRIDPKNNSGDRRWVEVEADLGPYAGKVVILELVTRMHNDGESDFNTAGWASPVIVRSDSK